MEVILKKNVEGLGKEGELLKVADGYARNYLIPRQIAVVATEKNRRVLQHENRIEEQKAAKEQRIAEDILSKISNITCTIPMRAGDNDRLFGSVTSAHIVSNLKEQGIEIERRNIQLEKPIRELGVFLVPIKLYKDITANLKVVVIKEGEIILD